MSKINRVLKFGKAVVRHAKDNFTKVTFDIFKKRLDVCNDCEHNKEGTCEECDCILSIKAWWASEDCPIDKWAKGP